MIEKQNSFLKNKKALDYIRNRQAGHILIDYRICCAMANFNHIPCIPDGKHTVQIANRIKKRCLKKQNKLGSLLLMSLPDFKSCPISEVKDIEDFPQMSVSQFKRRITLGSFKIRQSKSYLDQIIKHGTFFVLNEKQILKHINNEKLIQEFKESKLIGVLILSRHKRGKKSKKTDTGDTDPKNYTSYYKVFIQYYPTNSSEKKAYKNIRSILSSLFKLHFSIYQFQGYICSCLSGRQIAGCCVHVATVIYLLGIMNENFKKDSNFFINPAQHLNNIFINISRSDKSNEPKCIKQKRRFKTRIIDSDSPSTGILKMTVKI